VDFLVFWYSLLGVVVVINGIIVLKKMEKRHIFEAVKKVTEAEKNQFYLSKSNKAQVDFELKGTHVNVLIKLVKIKRQAKLIITNPKTWIVTEKSQPISLRNQLQNQAFLSENEVGTIKIVIIYPTQEAVLRFVNENEMEFITPTMTVSGCHFILYHQLDNAFCEVMDVYESKKEW